MNRLTIITTLIALLPGLFPVIAMGAGTGRVAGFEDAIGRIGATLEAKRGQQAIQSWKAASGGSVRLVGSFQKLSTKADVEVDVRVDGQIIWHQKLAATDSIRHGFDITAYDLKAQSKVDFRVTAGRESARVRAVLQIVPEPFVSRWRANLPTGYPVWSDDQRIALRNKGKGILQLLRDASAAKRRKVVIPPGDHLFHAEWSRASTLASLENMEIVAEGVTFWFEPPMVHALLFENCRNVTVRGLTIDFTIPCWFQARVTEIDRAAKTVRATIMAGYEPRNANGEAEVGGKRALMFYDADGRFINHRHSPGAWQLDGDGKSIVCRNIELAGIPASLKAGDHVVGTLRTGAALRSIQCAGMRFEDVNLWSSPGMAVNENGGEGGHLYRRVRATRRPHTNRLQAFGADIFHLAGADRGPTLDRCELAYGADDNLNFQRTLINGSPGGLIENNTPQNVGHGLVIQFETWGPWMEGPFARDLTVRGNRFLDSPPDGAAICVSMHPPGGGSNARRFEAKPVTNLTITDNDFARTTTTPIIIHNVDGLKIYGNSIDYPVDAPSHPGPGNTSGVNWLYLQDCLNVVQVPPKNQP